MSMLLLLIGSHHLPSAHSFPVSPARSILYSTNTPSLPNTATTFITKPRINIDSNIHRTNKSFTQLYAGEDSNDNVNDVGTSSSSLGESESTLLGIAGIIATSIMIYSESVLFQTGCGLPAGPLGLVGAAEGISYLGVVGLVAYSLYTKIRTGSGLPAGRGGVLGAAEGLAYLAVLGGILVLVSQVVNYGYIPNAVPMEGAMCK